jgi:hypothetical protein
MTSWAALMAVLSSQMTATTLQMHHMQPIEFGNSQLATRLSVISLQRSVNNTSGGHGDDDEYDDDIDGKLFSFLPLPH